MDAPKQCMACGSDDLVDMSGCPTDYPVIECAECEASHYQYRPGEWTYSSGSEREAYRAACDDVRTVFDG